jgi:F-type H+-transporting ATPase subunit gamma
VPNTRLIKRRIRSAQNIAKITKAMEMVSASKMRRAQQQVQASRPYATKLHSVLGRIGRHTDPSLHPLLQKGVSGSPCLVVISTDRGLCGGLNTNLFKAVLERSDAHADLKIVAVGKKAQEFAQRVGLTIVASFVALPEKIHFNDILPIAEIVREGFLSGEFSSVDAVHMEFINTLSQVPHLTSILPLGKETIETAPAEEGDGEYVFEPSARDILDALLPYYVEMEFFQLVLDGKASEHSARMISMQNASKNAKEVVGSLQLEYNKGRQTAITNALLEITSASMSLA